MTDEPDLPVDPDVDVEAPRRNRPVIIAVVGLGGALGAAARYGIDQAIPIETGGFPWATFLINVSGSLALGLFLVVVFERGRPSPCLRPFVATGFIGSFTTFSTFAVETDLLIKDDHVTTAAVYMGSTLAAGLLCAWLGIVMGRMLSPR